MIHALDGRGWGVGGWVEVGMRMRVSVDVGFPRVKTCCTPAQLRCLLYTIARGKKSSLTLVN